MSVDINNGYGSVQGYSRTNRSQGRSSGHRDEIASLQEALQPLFAQLKNMKHLVSNDGNEGSGEMGRHGGKHGTRDGGSDDAQAWAQASYHHYQSMFAGNAQSSKGTDDASDVDDADDVDGGGDDADDTDDFDRGNASAKVKPGKSSATTQSAGASTSGSGAAFHAQDQAIQQWAPDIQKAANASGLDPNLIGGQMWAESRGDVNSDSENIDGNTDKSLMQISQNTWNTYVIPGLSQDDRNKIKTATGKNPEDLDMGDPHDNVVGGAFELKQHIKDNNGDVDGALRDYVGVGDMQGYADNVNFFKQQLAQGVNLDDSR